MNIPNGFVVGKSIKTTLEWKKSADITYQANHSFPLQKYHYNPYFEITVTNCEGVIAIGVGLKPKDNKSLPGYEEGCYGYHSPDGNIFSGSFCGLEFGTPFSEGDTVGCGINLQGYVFFTKNGTYLGKIDKVNNGDLQYYPLIGLNSCVSLSVNFGSSPFAYDILTQFEHKNKSTEAGFANLPEEIVFAILSRMNVHSLCLFSQVYRGIHLVSKHNSIWEPLVFKKWPKASKTLAIKSYYSYYARRMEAISKAYVQKNRYQIIENCAERNCPTFRENLTESANGPYLLCKICKRTIELCPDYQPYHHDRWIAQSGVKRKHEKYLATYRLIELEEDT